jgi:hypothetical protein
MMAGVQSCRIQPGDVVQFANGANRPMRTRVVTACGTETITTLHPEARLEITAGQSPVDVIMDFDDYAGVNIVDLPEEG